MQGLLHPNQSFDPDEPTSGVDLKTQHDILHFLLTLNKKGITIILITHDLNAVAAHLPWIICFNKGIIAQGMPEDVFKPEILKRPIMQM